jgi:hypothetical protein
VKIDSETGSIIISELKPIGTYAIKVIGTLPDFGTSASALFTI